VLSLALASCSRGGAAAPEVLVIQDGAASDAREVVTPAVLGFGLGLEGSELDLRIVEVADLDVGDEVGDGDVVAAMVAPFTDVSADAIAALRAGGIPVLSLSELVQPDGSSTDAALRPFVSPLAVQADALEDLASGGSGCVAGDGTAWSEALSAAIERSVALAGGPEEVADAARQQGCDVVVWTGEAGSASALAPLLARTAPAAVLVLGDRARTPGFAQTTPAAGVVLGSCPCVDLGATADAAGQDFLHAYESATGLGAGPFSAEGYDAGRTLASAAGMGSNRETLGAALAVTTTVEGLAGTYVWDAEGDLRVPAVRMYERVGVRWLERSSDRVARSTARA
jgi:ABC-type branched-subunit amino acid transport system substrate-binding protein